MNVMTLRLPDELHDALRKQAAAEHVSANEYAVRALDAALSSRRRLRDELIDAIAVEHAETFDRLAHK
ncbi:MAG: CopG family transcriptional regulator [Acidimicrobiales bacterium]|nr:MAG: CopG family transcriptional regulator [Acidimicrobiales bacterium]